MAIKIQNTSDVSTNGIKCCVYGKAGAGKTRLMATAPNPFIISAEAGLLSIQGSGVDYAEIDSMAELEEAFNYLTQSQEAAKYETICLDSISEIAETMLIEYKRAFNDPRQAYGLLGDDMGDWIRKFRDIIGKNVVFSAKRIRITDDDTGITQYMPSMPGKNLLNGLPFFFDEVFYLTEMLGGDGTEYDVLKTKAELNFEAKDRSGKLNSIEEPNLTKIFEKIKGN